MRELREGPSPAERRPVDDRRLSGVPDERASAMDRHGAPRIPHDDADSRTPSHPRPPDHISEAPAAPEVPEGAADALARFDPRRAGLPDVPKGDAPRYIDANCADRPWLNAAREAPEDVQRVFAALDQGGGHAHIRHEGWLTPEKSELRVLYLQDPAQLDPQKRAQGKDGFLPGDKSHYCAVMSTAIRDPTAFAFAVVRGAEHPNIRAVLDRPQPSDKAQPALVSVPIGDLLGPDGHQYCEGYRLAGEDPKQAVADRRTWLHETRTGESPSVSPPLVVPLDFRGGNIQYAFKLNAAGEYGLLSMYPAPPDH